MQSAHSYINAIGMIQYFVWSIIYKRHNIFCLWYYTCIIEYHWIWTQWKKMWRHCGRLFWLCADYRPFARNVLNRFLYWMSLKGDKWLFKIYFVSLLCIAIFRTSWQFLIDPCPHVGKIQRNLVVVQSKVGGVEVRTLDQPRRVPHLAVGLIVTYGV